MLWIVMKYKLPVISTYHNYWCEWNYKKWTYSNVADKNNLMYLKYSNKYKSILFSMYDWFLTTWKWSSGWWHCSILVLANVFGREWPSIFRASQCHNSKDHNLLFYHQWNLKYHNFKCLFHILFRILGSLGWNGKN